MKVQITKEAKQWLTVAQMPEVRKMIADLKDDDIKSYVRTMMHFLEGNNFFSVKVFEATAEISRNIRVKDRYTDSSGDLDVWINFIAYGSGSDSFIRGGVYLSDIWSITGTEEDNKLKSRMYVARYILTK